MFGEGSAENAPFREISSDELNGFPGSNNRYAEIGYADISYDGFGGGGGRAPTAHAILYDEPSVLLALARRASQVGAFNRTIAQISSELLDAQSGTYVTSY